MQFSAKGPLTRAEAETLFERIHVRTRCGEPTQFAVITRETQELIGYCGFFLQNVDGVDEIEIGYRLHPDWWGGGLATEAARAVRDHASARSASSASSPSFIRAISVRNAWPGRTAGERKGDAI
jgi:RimJ/RimL family protein N-acetyltransferase